MTTTEPKRSGRPPDKAAGRALTAAALQLVREKGYAGVSIAEIAAKAGVARQTLYNRWKTKADLVLDAVFEETGRHSAEPPGETGESAAAQLERFLTGVFTHLTEDGEPLRALIAAAQEDAVFRDDFRERFVLPREEIVTDLLRRAQARGELGPERDPALLSAFIHGAFWYRLLNGLPVTPDLAREMTKEIFGR